MNLLFKEIRRNPVLWLLTFVPVVLLAQRIEPEAHTLLLVFSMLAIVPLAALLSHATEAVPVRTGDSVGGLLNATLGNLTELVIALTALRAGQFLAPVSGHGLGFLRALRALRLFRPCRIVSRMKRDFPFVQRNYEAIVAGTHLFVFLFVMTAVVYETQHQNNPAIGNYLDALYFTVATLTTTGFGDITLPGTTGRLLSIPMMIVGVSLFVRMAQVLFRPRRMHDNCASCGLSEHETDAVHCKRCGMLLQHDDVPPLQEFRLLSYRMPRLGT